MKLLNKHFLSQVGGALLIYPNGHELQVATYGVPGMDFIQIEFLIQSLFFHQISLNEYQNQLASLSHSSVQAYMSNFKTAHQDLDCVSK